MPIDPNNPVVHLCAEGIQAEMAGRREDAAALYQRAWDSRTDEFEACIAAHYLARLQSDPANILHWNQLSLEHAGAVKDDRVAEFYPSLYLNLGKAHEDLGHRAEARRFYELAAEKVEALPEGKYADIVKQGIANGIARTA